MAGLTYGGGIGLAGREGAALLVRLVLRGKSLQLDGKTLIMER